MSSSPQSGPDHTRSKRIIWIVVGVVIVALVALFLSRLSAPASGDAGKVEAALKGSASTLLAGTGEPAALAAATCESVGDDGTEYGCVPKGLSEEQSILFVLADDGTISEALAGDPDPASLRSGDGLAKALAADAKARGLGDPEYGCVTSIRMGPDGTSEAGNAAGYLCVAKTAATPSNSVAPDEDGAAGSSAAAGARYVETLPDGTLRRDYVIRSK
ncbi:MAG: hypothetical protein Q7T55_00185 [Solirubrobacteraceae bacterium]|nr:hypothetical protein [Solirubrobacteraceae bacterium]